MLLKVLASLRNAVYVRRNIVKKTFIWVEVQGILPTTTALAIRTWNL